MLGPATAVALGLLTASPFSPARAVPLGALAATPPGPARAIPAGWAWAIVGSNGSSAAITSAKQTQISFVTMNLYRIQECLDKLLRKSS